MTWLQKITFGLIVLALGACSSDKKSKKQFFHEYYFSPNLFTGYILQDIACQRESFGLINLTSTSLYQYDPEIELSSLVSVSLKGLHSSTSLTGDLINRTSYNLHQKKDCTSSDFGARNCDGAFEAVSPQIDLKVCSLDKTFVRLSIEQVGLSSVYHLEKANKFFNILKSPKALAKTFISVLPIIEYVFLDPDTNKPLSLYTTNQLSYVRTEDNKAGFFIYPQSTDLDPQEKWKNINFWEWDWAISHEFGHHVLTELTEYITGEVNLSSEEKNHPKYIAPPIISAKSMKQRQLISFDLIREVTKEDIVGAVHEGFADLFGYYSTGGKPNRLKGIQCFAKNRDVSSATFYNNQPKKLSASVLNTFYSSTHELSIGDCNDVSFQDIHTIGAIIAHSMDRVFKTKHPNIINRAALLVKWALRLNYLKNKTLKLEDILADGIYNVSTNGVLNEAQCAILQEQFPASYISYWASSASRTQLTCP